MGSLETGLTDEVLARWSSSWMTLPKATGASSDGLRPHPEHTRGAASGRGARGREADPAQARVVPALARHLPRHCKGPGCPLCSRPPTATPPVDAVRQHLAFYHLDCRTRRLDLDVENFHSNQYIDKVTLKSN